MIKVGTVLTYGKGVITIILYNVDLSKDSTYRPELHYEATKMNFIDYDNSTKRLTINPTSLS